MKCCRALTRGFRCFTILSSPPLFPYPGNGPGHGKAPDVEVRVLIFAPVRGLSKRRVIGHAGEILAA